MIFRLDGTVQTPRTPFLALSTAGTARAGHCPSPANTSVLRDVMHIPEPLAVVRFRTDSVLPQRPDVDVEYTTPERAEQTLDHVAAPWTALQGGPKETATSTATTIHRFSRSYRRVICPVPPLAFIARPAPYMYFSSN